MRRLPEEPQTRSIPAENPATSTATTGKHFEGDTVFGLHGTAGTVRGWRRPMANTQIVPTVAVAAIGIMASGKLPVSAWIQPILHQAIPTTVPRTAPCWHTYRLRSE
jgi:hypothetical protein